jgi:hypothetical protein
MDALPASEHQPDAVALALVQAAISAPTSPWTDAQARSFIKPWPNVLDFVSWSARVRWRRAWRAGLIRIQGRDT